MRQKHYFGLALLLTLSLFLSACIPQNIQITIDPPISERSDLMPDNATAPIKAGDGAEPGGTEPGDTESEGVEGDEDLPADDPMAALMAGGGESSEQIPYDELVADAEKQSGLFNVYHTEDGEWYWEIPQSLLGQDLLWYTELTKVPATFSDGLGVVAEKMVEFGRIDERIILYEMSSVLTRRGTEEEGAPINRAVAESAQPAVLLALPIVSESPEGDMVIAVGALFQNDLPDFSLSEVFEGGFSADPERSFVQNIQAFSNNVAVTSLLTSMGGDGGFGGDFGGGEASFGPPPPAGSTSVEVRHNLTLLPEEPMMARHFDPRVGYFTVDFDDFSGERERDVTSRHLITRFRLVKKDPTAPLSEPIEPIVFYISREVPDVWRSYMKQGVQDWRPAFEAAGFTDAIVVKDAPSEVDDPEWDPADTRYSVIRWVAQSVPNAIGPSTVDPRSGEILSSHVQIYAELLERLEQMYFVQASAVDENARALPLPEEILGEMIRYVTAHEVGHSLGLRHNHRASQAYTVEELRNPEFTDEYGVGSSIMSYGRLNYVAQPGDGVTNLIPSIGRYDIFAIEWGYTPLPTATSSEDEFPQLDQWAARQLDDPWLAFGGEDEPAMVDPTVLTENIGAERIEATRLGIENLARVMDYLAAATTQPGRDFVLLDKTYKSLLDHRTLWLTSVIKLVGGVEETRTLAGRGEQQFQRVPAERQRAAVQFVLENLQPQPHFRPAAILNQTGSFWVTRYFVEQQQSLLTGLLKSPFRSYQLMDGETINPNDAYPFVELMQDVQTDLFSELSEEEIEIAPMRRTLQRHYLKILKEHLAGEEGELINTDSRAAVRWNLQQLATELTTAAAASTDLATQAHLADLEIEVEDLLDNK